MQKRTSHVQGEGVDTSKYVRQKVPFAFIFKHSHIQGTFIILFVSGDGFHYRSIKHLL